MRCTVGGGGKPSSSGMGQLSTLIPPTSRTRRNLRWQPPVGITLNAPTTVHHLIAPFGMQSFAYMPRFGILSTHPPTPCGLATFSAALADGLSAKGAAVSVVRIADGSDSAHPNV